MDYEIVAEGLNFPEGPLVLDDGQLIVCEVAGGRLMRIARDGTLSVFAETGGSPSGLAVGPDGAIYCCNNGGFDWDSAAKVPTRTRPLPDASRTSGGGTGPASSGLRLSSGCSRPSVAASRGRGDEPPPKSPSKALASPSRIFPAVLTAPPAARAAPSTARIASLPCAAAGLPAEALAKAGVLVGVLTGAA